MSQSAAYSALRPRAKDDSHIHTTTPQQRLTHSQSFPANQTPAATATGFHSNSLVDTPGLHGLATTPYNSPIFHPDLFTHSANAAQQPIDFASFFPGHVAPSPSPTHLTGLPTNTPFHTGAIGIPQATPYQRFPLNSPSVSSAYGVTMTPMQPASSPTHQSNVASLAASQPQLTVAQLHQLSQLQQLHALQQQILQQTQNQPPMQAVYATPAAWHKQRQFLMNQPTPQALETLPLATTAPNTRMKASPSPTNSRLMSSPPVKSERNLSIDSNAAPSDSGDHLPANSPTSLHRRAMSSISLTSPAPAGGASRGRSSSVSKPRSKDPAISAAAANSSNLAHIQASLRHLKKLQLLHEEEKAVAMQKSRIQKTFLSLSSFLIVVFVGILCYYDYLILSPHLHALFWAFLFWVLLDAPQKWLLKVFSIIDQRVVEHYGKSIVMCASIFTILLGFIFRAHLSSLIIIGVSFFTFTFFVFGERYNVTAILLLVFIMGLLAFPLFLFTKTCVLESQEIAARIRAFVESNAEFQHILEDFSTSHTFIAMQNYCRSWGYEIPTTSVEQLRELILNSMVKFADQITTILLSAYGVISNLGNLLVGLVTFASMLYFLLVSNRDFNGTLTWLSPFSADDNTKLVSTLKKSVMSIFVCSLSVGFIHVVVTYISFSLCGIDLCLILSFISGFAAMLPIFSSWIIWMPACGGLLLAGHTFQAVALGVIQLTMVFYIDPLIYSNIPGNSYIIGVSIVFAAYTFGAAGVLLGPLLAGMTFTFLSIYRDYISLPIYTAPQPPIQSPITVSPDYTMQTGAVDPMSYPMSYPNSSPLSSPEIGSLSTSHSSNTLAQLESSLQAVADSTSRNTTPAPVRGPSPLSRSRSEESPASTSRTLRFATPLHGSNSTSTATTPNTPAIRPNSTTTPTATASIIEEEEHDHDHDHEEDHDHDDSNSSLHLDASHDELLQHYDDAESNDDSSTSPINLAQKQLQDNIDRAIAQLQFQHRQSSGTNEDLVDTSEDEDEKATEETNAKSNVESKSPGVLRQRATTTNRT